VNIELNEGTKYKTLSVGFCTKDPLNKVHYYWLTLTDVNVKRRFRVTTITILMSCL
jgi:hypothetical protein